MSRASDNSWPWALRRAAVLARALSAASAVSTAGIRRRAKHKKGVEYFSILRSVQAIQRSDVAILVLDASEGIVAQDARVAGEIHESGRACVVLWNKWDLVEKETMTYREYEQKVADELAFPPQGGRELDLTTLLVLLGPGADIAGSALTIPPGLAGLDLHFQGFFLDDLGGLEFSNTETIRFVE